MWLVAAGLTNKEISQRLEISEHTAKWHVSTLTRKFDEKTRTGAAVRFVLERPDVAAEMLGRIR